VPKKSDESRVVFTDGHVLNKNFIAISSYVEAYEDSDHARIFTFTDQEWSYFDLDSDVRSIAGAERPSRILFCMGRDGRINIEKKEPLEEVIRDAGSDEDNWATCTKSGLLVRRRMCAELVIRSIGEPRRAGPLRRGCA